MKRPIPLRIIAKAIAEYFDIKEIDIFERTRKRKVKDKRYIFFALAREFNSQTLTLGVIGKYCEVTFGIKAFDHATVLYGYNQVKIYCETEKEFLKQYIDIKFLADNLADTTVDLTSLNDIKRQAIKKILESESEQEIYNFLNG